METKMMCGAVWCDVRRKDWKIRQFRCDVYAFFSLKIWRRTKCTLCNLLFFYDCHLFPFNFVLIATVFIIHKFYNTCVCYAKSHAKSRVRITNWSDATENATIWQTSDRSSGQPYLQVSFFFFLYNFFDDDLMFRMAKQNLLFPSSNL